MKLRRCSGRVSQLGAALIGGTVLLALTVFGGVAPASAAEVGPPAGGAPAPAAFEVAAGTRIVMPDGTLEAAPTQPVAPACTNALDVGVTLKSGSLIKGQGSWTKCNDSLNRVQVVLFQSAWDGSPVWNGVVVHNWDPANFGSWIDNVQFNCSGAGARQYYVKVEGWNASGTLTASKTSNTLTASC